MNDIDIIRLNFHDNKVPEFKEVTNKDYILCGEKNDYPEFLLYLYNKSGKHRAIVNGKTKYIFGGGLDGAGGFATTDNDKAVTINNDGETMHDVLKKSIKDVEIYGGFRWFVTVDKAGKIADIRHCDYNKFRTAKPKDIIDEKTGEKVGEEGHGYLYKEKWIKANGYADREEPTFYPEFTGPKEGEKLVGTYVFGYNEPGPGTDYYPLPGYIGCVNAIETDVEMGKAHLSGIKNGMRPSKMIQFYTGDTTDEKKKSVEKRLQGKFSGSENTGNFFLVFNSSKEKTVDVTDLSGTELDKMYDLLARQIEQEIFTGHEVTSPMLFGIKTEGQLGGATELKVAHEIFTNTYAKNKQQDIEQIVNWFGGLMGKGSEYKFKQLEPVGMILDVKDFINILPTQFILDKLGVPKEYTQPAQPTIQPAVPGQPAQTTTAPIEAVNDNIKNLTAKQYQQLVRTIREYSKGKITIDVARAMLRAGYGLSESEVDTYLGVGEETMQSEDFLRELRQAEVDKIVRPELKLNFIKDKKVLSKRIMYPVADKEGNIINARVSVKRLQDKIEQEMKGLEQTLNEAYAN